MLVRRRGFTLIELLVVIAIIAILAAMLFPVFARARESARKIQCLSNVKNIATAFQMYLTDYDRLPPSEHAADSEEYFSTEPGKGGGGDHPDCNHKTHANPYLRWPVILEEYVRNRDVWRCPSATLAKGVTVVVTALPNWVQYWKDHDGMWGRESDCNGGGPCGVAWPPGWGGSITDSIEQGRCASPETSSAFEQSVGTTTSNADMKTSQIADPSWFALCGDTGGQVELWSAVFLAFPEQCAALGCGDWPPFGGGACCAGDWEGCGTDDWCSFIDWQLKLKFFEDANVRKQFARHLGGSNVGFADGHAAWMSGDSILAESPYVNFTTCDCRCDNGHLRGVGGYCRY